MIALLGITGLVAAWFAALTAYNNGHRLPVLIAAVLLALWALRKDTVQ